MGWCVARTRGVVPRHSRRMARRDPPTSDNVFRVVHLAGSILRHRRPRARSLAVRLVDRLLRIGSLLRRCSSRCARVARERSRPRPKSRPDALGILETSKPLTNLVVPPLGVLRPLRSPHAIRSPHRRAHLGRRSHPHRRPPSPRPTRSHHLRRVPVPRPLRPRHSTRRGRRALGTILPSGTSGTRDPRQLRVPRERPGHTPRRDRARVSSSASIRV